MWLKSKAAVAEAPAEAAPAPVPRKGWFEKRRERRKKRRLFEEVVAWIFVPALIYGCYLLYQASGGLPPAAFEFLGEMTSMALRGGR
jgi:hypothetical protein